VKSFQKDKCKLQYIFVYIKFSIPLITIALYLGSWWALQEGSWGGWWNWDASEFFGLLIFYYLILSVHRPDLVKSLLLLVNFLLKTQYLLVIFFLLLQLNFNVISHNFGFRSTKFLNIEALLGLFLLFFSFTLQNSVKTFSALVLELTTTKLTNVKPCYGSILLFNTINAIVTLSLINFLVKVITSLKFFVSFLSFYKLLCIIWVYSWLRFLVASYNCVSFIYLSYLSFYCVLLFVKSWRGHLLQFYIHYVLFITFTINIVGKYFTINNFLHTNLVDTVTRSSYLSLNIVEIELWLNFLVSSTSFEGKSFNICLIQNYTQQLYLLNTSYFFTVVNSLEPTPFILNTLLVFLLMLFTCCFTYPKLFL